MCGKIARRRSRLHAAVILIYGDGKYWQNKKVTDESNNCNDTHSHSSKHLSFWQENCFSFWCPWNKNYVGWQRFRFFPVPFLLVWKMSEIANSIWTPNPNVLTPHIHQNLALIFRKSVTKTAYPLPVLSSVYNGRYDVVDFEVLQSNWTRVDYSTEQKTLDCNLSRSETGGKEIVKWRQR